MKDNFGALGSNILQWPPFAFIDSGLFLLSPLSTFLGQLTTKNELVMTQNRKDGNKEKTIDISLLVDC